jgi:glyoxylase-like metal-dependent hydrolase (beta-lactamase superfamily II)
MSEIAPNVYLIEGLRTSNVYLLVSDGELSLVDAAMAGDGDHIVAQIEAQGYSPDALRTVVLTHAHSDHIGGAPELLRRFDVEMLAHREEVPYVEGTESLPARGVLRRLVNWAVERMPGASSQIQVARGLEDGDVLDILGGLAALHTPGHTPGSLYLYQEAEGILFCGDLLTHGHPLTGRGGLRYGPDMFSVDPETMVRSVRRLSELPVDVLCVGHGEPIVSEASARIRALLPSHGA